MECKPHYFIYIVQGTDNTTSNLTAFACKVVPGIFNNSGDVVI